MICRFRKVMVVVAVVTAVVALLGDALDVVEQILDIIHRGERLGAWEGDYRCLGSDEETSLILGC